MVKIVPEQLRPGIGCRWDHYIPGKPITRDKTRMVEIAEATIPVKDLAVDTFSSKDRTFVREEGGITAEDGVVVGSDIPIARMDWLRSLFFEFTRRFEEGQEWVIEAIATGKALAIDRPLANCVWTAAYTTPGPVLESTSRPGEEEGVTVLGFEPERESDLTAKELTMLEERVEREVFPVQNIRTYQEEDIDLMDLVLRTPPTMTGWDFQNSIVVTTGETTVSWEEHRTLFDIVQNWYEEVDWNPPGLDSSAWIAT